MEKVAPLLRQLYPTFTLDYARTVVDILLVAFLIFQLFRLVVGTQAWRILGGIVFFFFLLLMAKVLGLQTLYAILEKATLLGPAALVILFLPQLRQAIEKVPNLLPEFTKSTTDAATLEEMMTAVAEFSRSRTGALFVLDRGNSLDEIVATGVRLDAQISSSLLGSIFYEQNPLHDGAVVIRGERLLAAACQLPLSEGNKLDRHMHMRHRAAVGVTEVLDCISVVVSEERGTISVAHDGRIDRVADIPELRTVLRALLQGEEVAPRKLFSGRRAKKEASKEAKAKEMVG